MSLAALPDWALAVLALLEVATVMALIAIPIALREAVPSWFPWKRDHLDPHWRDLFEHVRESGTLVSTSNSHRGRAAFE